MQYTLLDAWNTLQTINSNYFRGCHGSGLLLTFIIHPLNFVQTELHRDFVTQYQKDIFKPGQPLKSMLKYYWLMIAKIIYAIGV